MPDPRCLLSFALVLTVAVSSAPAEEARVDFDRQVRPILAEHCLACHGPDGHHRKAGLRLDTHDGALASLESGHRAVVAGEPDASELIKRITHTDPDERMPKSKPALEPREVDILRKWIAQGADWSEHWAFVKPVRPQLPKVKRTDWPRNPIDHFILARLEANGLTASGAADKRTLIRRVTLDLTGLPPTPAEVAAFVADDSPEAYERLVDRLLASEAYGERMAWPWLDAARYADTSGYQGDPTRTIWPWRDWVVRALNDNKPFDEFTIEQLSGDLLPNATNEQRLATAFNRNNMYNGEGGRIAEETRVENVFDRTETTGTVWLGLTFECCRCHDHKFDPVGIDEYFAMFDFFNHISERGNANVNEGNIPPVMSYTPPVQQARLAEFDARIDALRKKLTAPDADLDKAMAVWETDWQKHRANRWRTLDAHAYTSTQGATITKRDDGALHVTGELPEKDIYEIAARIEPVDGVGVTALKLDALVDPQSQAGGVGRDERGNFVLSEIELAVRPADDPDAEPKPVKIVRAEADHSQQGYEIAHAIDGKIDSQKGWAVDGHVRREPRTATFFLEREIAVDGPVELGVRLRHESSHTHHTLALFRLKVASDRAITRVNWSPWKEASLFAPPGNDQAVAYNHVYGPERGVDLNDTYADGKIKWKPGNKYADGKIHLLAGAYGAYYFYRTVHAPQRRYVTLSLSSGDAIKVWLNGKLVHANDARRDPEPDDDLVDITLEPGENTLLMKIVNIGGRGGFYFKATEKPLETPGPAVAAALDVPADKRTDAQRATVREHYRRAHVPELAEIGQTLDTLLNERAEFAKSSSNLKVMVMDTIAKPRNTHVLTKGLYNAKTDKTVTAGVPEALHPLPAKPEGERYDRLDLAKWIVSPDNPLTARVTVNRYWQTFFGKGIVATPGDFGLQGARPTHPELLDWLAVEFVESGWDVKRMHKLIVMSATYRQSAKTAPELAEADPTNKLLGRAPRHRMPSWMLRDAALSTSGLLVDDVGGPPVMPYHPMGIWDEATFGKKRYKRDSGDPLYRRSLYTFWRRIVGPTMFFDASKRQTCEVKPNLTNTPLHALTTLNDEQYVEAARVLAERLIKSHDTAGERVAAAFVVLTAREPETDELSLLERRLGLLIAQYRANPEQATKLLATGESKRDASIDPAEHAAYTAMFNMMMNLDEALVKP